jgi:hypothetical protein
MSGGGSSSFGEDKFEVGNKVRWKTRNSAQQDEIYTIENVGANGRYDLKASTGEMVYEVDGKELELLDPNFPGA